MAVTKIINSETKNYKPLLTDKLVLDDAPKSGSFNAITSDAVYRAISVDPGNVPAVAEGDNGKVLTASYSEGEGSFEWATPSGGSDIPEYSADDADKVLGVVVDSSGDTPVASLDWVDQPANELPAQLGTAGQVLTVNSGATGVEWATPSGGGGSSNVEIINLPQSSASDADILAAYNAAVAAYTANKAIIGKITGSQGKYKYIVCTKVSYGDGNYTFEFSGTMDDFPGSTPSVPLYVWGQLACAPSESYYSMLYKCASLGVTLQNWNPWYIPE